MSCESSIDDLTMEMFEDDCRDPGLLSHINELQEAVLEMKQAFTSAQVQLETMMSAQEEDRSIREDMDKSKTQCQNQSTEILRLILDLKSDFSSLKEIVQNTQIMQENVGSTVQALILERDLLLDELVKNGAIGEALRTKMHSRLSCNFNNRSSSGSQSTSDSGIAILLEKAQAAFQFNSYNSNGRIHNNSNFNGGMHYPGHYADSLPDHQGHHHTSSHIHNFLNGLSAADPFHSTTGEANQGGVTSVTYDSDSSLTMAAAKSLSLSNSLSKQCGLELDQENQKNNRALEENDFDIQLQGDESQNSCGKDSTKSYNSNKEIILPLEETRNESSVVNGGKEEISFKETQRLKVVKELVETERKYCDTLRTIQQTFAQPLKETEILSMKDINTLFPEEVFTLFDCHCVLLNRLEERLDTWKPQSRIGDLLEKFTNNESDVLRLYTNYVNDFPEVLKTFHKLCRNCTEFTQFLKNCLEKCGGLDLGAFLLTPVQRMPRYILLLKQMIKFTDSDHVDYKDITTCLDRLRDYLKRLNDSMDHTFKLITAQIAPTPHHESLNRKNSMEGFSNKNSFPRESISSNSSGEDIIHKVRYKRSKSVEKGIVSRNNETEAINSANCCLKEKAKLKLRSKSDWAVSGSNSSKCQGCNCRNQKNTFEKEELSDSDINSDGEDETIREKNDGKNKKINKRKFPASKSLYDFDFNNSDEELNIPENPTSLDWTNSEPSLCNATRLLSLQRQNVTTMVDSRGREREVTKNSSTILRNNVMLRPFTSIPPGNKYVARIQKDSVWRQRKTSEQELCNEIDPPKDSNKKRSSIRNSLKNIFSLKKRVSRTFEISQPIIGKSTASKSKYTSSYCSFNSELDVNSPHPENNSNSLPTHRWGGGSSNSRYQTFSDGGDPSVQMTKYGIHYIDEEGKSCTNV